MNSERADSHAEMLELLPWWVNGTLDPVDRVRVERHLRECAECRVEAWQQRRLFEAMRREASSVEHAPQAGFERLWSRIEELDRDVPRPTREVEPNLARRRSDPPPTRWLLAASVVLAFGAGVLGAALYQASTTPPPTEFRTATTVVSAPVRGPQVRAVFASATTVEDLHRIARAAGVRIVDGPSEAGVYTLALDSTAPGSMDDALDRLRGDPRVRFAEPVSAGGSP